MSSTPPFFYSKNNILLFLLPCWASYLFEAYHSFKVHILLTHFFSKKQRTICVFLLLGELNSDDDSIRWQSTTATKTNRTLSDQIPRLAHNWISSKLNWEGVEETGTVGDRSKVGIPLSVRRPNWRVLLAIEENPHNSLRRLSQTYPSCNCTKKF